MLRDRIALLTIVCSLLVGAATPVSTQVALCIPCLMTSSLPEMWRMKLTCLSNANSSMGAVLAQAGPGREICLEDIRAELALSGVSVGQTMELTCATDTVLGGLTVLQKAEPQLSISGGLLEQALSNAYAQNFLTDQADVYHSVIQPQEPAVSPQKFIRVMPTAFAQEVFDWLFGVRCGVLCEPNTWEQDLSGLTWQPKDGRKNATELVDGAYGGHCKIASDAADHNLFLAFYSLAVLIWIGLVISGLCMYFAGRMVWALWKAHRAKMQRQSAQQA